MVKTTERSLLRDRNFLLYFFGVLFSEAGVRGTLAINLYHVYLLTESTWQVGLIGLSQALALILLGTLGGATADRLDRRRLIQLTQGLSCLVSALLTVLTLTGLVAPWHIFVSAMLNSAAATFDAPARQALIPALVPRTQLVKAFALVNPAREFAWLAGPAAGGLLVAVGGPGVVYALDTGTYVLLIIVLGIIRLRPMPPADTSVSVLASIRAGVRFVRVRPIIWQLLALDLVAMLFAAWRVVLPALSEDVLDVGPAGYGLLSAVVPGGALLGSWMIFQTIDRLHAGAVVLSATAAFGLACIGLAHSPTLVLAGMACFAIGMSDALWSTVQQAAIQIETPDDMRGRVSSIHHLAARGGPSLGNANLGWIAALLGPIGALTLGGLVPVIAAGVVALRSPTLRDYKLPSDDG